MALPAPIARYVGKAAQGVRRLTQPHSFAVFNPAEPIPISKAASDLADERAKTAKELEATLLNREHTSEVFGTANLPLSSNLSDIMPTTDEVARKFSAGKGYEIYPQMRRNCLKYGALQSQLTDTLLSLRMTWIAGKKGDTASEKAREEVESAWSNIEELKTALYAIADAGFEAGFAPAELIWGRHSRGAAKGFIFPRYVINRPVSWFAFDWMNRPYFRPNYYRKTASPLSGNKVVFIRYGSLHTAYGAGTGQFCYPTVWTIDASVKGYLQAAERYGYPLIVATYPAIWGDGPKTRSFEYNLHRTYKNYLAFPGEVDEVSITPVGGGGSVATYDGKAQLQIIQKLEDWLSYYLVGGVLSMSTQAEGGYSRDQVHADQIFLKCGQRAGSIEAMVNRGMVRPAMLVNHPELDESLWPRLSIDVQPTEDLEDLRASVEQGVKLKFPISQTWWSETFNIPAAQEGEATLEAAAPPAMLPPVAEDDEGTDTPPDEFTAMRNRANAQRAAARMMSERGVIVCTNAAGDQVRFYDNEAVATENRGWVRASTLTGDDVPVVHEFQVIRARS